MTLFLMPGERLVVLAEQQWSRRVAHGRCVNWTRGRRCMADEGAAGGATRASGGTADVVLEVCPQECLHDVRTDIRVSGLTPNTSCTFRMDTHNDQGRKFSSHAHYVSDDHGRVDVATSEAVGGSYTGVFPVGLFLTLRENPDERHRMFKDDPTTPWQMKLAVFEGHLTLEESEAGEASVASTMLYRHLMRPGMRRIPVRQGRILGVLYMPQGDGPFPGLVDIFGVKTLREYRAGSYVVLRECRAGSYVVLREYRAAMLASRGFASFALCLYNCEDLPKEPEVYELEYFEEAVEFLLSQPEVIPDRCGIVSSSKGRSLA
ncbi:acyl-coenzyme A thioesterase 3-like isoform X2 [Panulirus ornatus]|uniref:acyl-coenzyme A thioesterase 3-like isoform X2 n=1 Tax=Panulirus ornatus TaxID=150431 RepID=UPI003A85F40B